MDQARNKIVLFYLISVFFILLNAFVVVISNSMIINALPLLFLIILLAVYALDKLLYLVVFFTPLSLPLSELIPGLTFNMSVPTEPLLFGILLLFIGKSFTFGKYEREILTHPVSLAIYLGLFWLFITSMTSSMPIVSLKFFLARLWFIAGFYLLAAKLFESGKNIEKFIWLYMLPLLLVIFYATYRHLGYGLSNKQAANFVVNPLYNDHTAYGAALAMYLPFLLGFSFTRIYSPKIKPFVQIVLGIVLTGLILSYARAAWISMVVALAVWIIQRLKLQFKLLFFAFLISISLTLIFQNQLLMVLERNNTESSANLGNHISSISNITSDASNLERINRWSCALRMFQEKPVWGWGPGTYMFNYAPYQLTSNRTIISTNSADGGNAHSEYLSPLAESGFMGLITFLILIVTVIYTAVNTYSRTDDKRLKTIAMSALLGLVTYYTHGILNNFLDTDKLSLPFWGFTAIIVSLDIYTRKISSTEALLKNQQ